MNDLSVSKLMAYVRRIVSGEQQAKHFYKRERSIPDDEFAAFVGGLTETDADRVSRVRKQLLADQQFFDAIEERLQRTAFRPDTLHRNWRETLYAIVILTNPSTVVETGVYDGLSSAYILKGLSDAGQGELVSIDIGDSDSLPDDLDVKPGWVVPDSLRNRWTIEFGDSKDVLPQVVEERQISMFLHDSLHTEEHMRFEFTTAVKGMTSGGVFLSDNVEFNDVFDTFAADILLEPYYLQNTTENYDYDGNPVDDRLGGGVLE